MMEVGERLQEAVVLVEAALQRPRVPVARLVHVAVLTEVPLADRESAVAVRPEQLRESGLVGRQLAV